MSSLNDWVTVICTFAGAGALIDFALGKRGQKKVRSALETWWIRLSDVKATSFGRDEAILASRFLECLFGKFISWRRLGWMLGMYPIGLTLWWCFAWIQRNKVIDFRYTPPPTYDNLSVLVGAVLMSASISLTLKMCGLAAAITSQRVIINLTTLVLLLSAQYLAFKWLAETIHLAVALIANEAITPSPGPDKVAYLFELVSYQFWIGWKTGYSVLSSYDWIAQPRWENVLFFVAESQVFFPIIVRTLFLLIFLASFLIKPIHQTVTGLVLRIAESDKPACTLVMGAIGAITKGLYEILTRLYQ